MTKYILKAGFDKMDFDKVTAMLAETWWSPEIKKSEIMQAARNSALVVGAFIESGGQIGYARVISDKTRFAYISDVIVDKKYRKLGIGQAMTNFILNHTELKDVYQWLLVTKDAHGVYRKAGFNPLPDPGEWLMIRKDRPKR